jgi:HKD family nuclease
MATKELIFQGLDARTHCDEVKRLLNLPNVERVAISVAFINENGVDLIEDELNAVSDRTTVYGGISNGVTSRQGLERLFGLGLDLFVIDTGSLGVTYHPKLYYSRNKEQARFIAGSANFTLGGLNNNIEASVVMGLDLADADDLAFAKNIEAQLEAIHRDFPDNAKQVTSSAYLAELMNGGSIIDERTASTRRSSTSGSSSSTGTPTPRMALKVPQVRGGDSQVSIEEPAAEVAPEPAEATPEPSPAMPAPEASAPETVEAGTEPSATASTASGPASAAVAATHPPAGTSNGPLVWRKSNLRGTDAQQPPSAGTNPTGNLRFAQARFIATSGLINHRTYFRNDVFGRLPWTPSGGDMESASANFRIIHRGHHLGDFTLRISHAPRRIAHQNNVPTVLHWGDALDAIRAANVLGTTLSLYGPDSSGTFTIEFS